MAPLAAVDIIGLAMVALDWSSILSMSIRGSQVCLWHSE